MISLSSSFPPPSWPSSVVVGSSEYRLPTQTLIASGELAVRAETGARGLAVGYVIFIVPTLIPLMNNLASALSADFGFRLFMAKWTHVWCGIRASGAEQITSSGTWAVVSEATALDLILICELSRTDIWRTSRPA